MKRCRSVTRTRKGRGTLQLRPPSERISVGRRFAFRCLRSQTTDTFGGSTGRTLFWTKSNHPRRRVATMKKYPDHRHRKCNDFAVRTMMSGIKIGDRTRITAEIKSRKNGRTSQAPRGSRRGASMSSDRGFRLLLISCATNVPRSAPSGGARAARCTRRGRGVRRVHAVVMRFGRRRAATHLPTSHFQLRSAPRNNPDDHNAARYRIARRSYE